MSEGLTQLRRTFSTGPQCFDGDRAASACETMYWISSAEQVV
ncbi:MAG: hypothetical protein R3A52_03625 [Polyangiales bacterium]